MFSVGFLGGFLVGLLLLVTALLSSGDRDRHHDNHSSSMGDRMGSMHNQMGSMRDQMGSMHDQMGSMRDQMSDMFGNSYPATPEDIEGYMRQNSRNNSSNDQPPTTTTESYEQALKMFEDFIDRERANFEKLFPSIPEDEQVMERRLFDEWLTDRTEEFKRNNPLP